MPYPNDQNSTGFDPAIPIGIGLGVILYTYIYRPLVLAVVLAFNPALDFRLGLN